MQRIQSFSERQGIEKPRLLKPEELPSSLRTRLWNNICGFIEKAGGLDAWRTCFLYLGKVHYGIETVGYSGWNESSFQNHIRKDIVGREAAIPKDRVGSEAVAWNKVYDMIEWLYEGTKSKALNGCETNFEKTINEAFEWDLAAWRMVNGKIVEFTSNVEIKAVEDALAVTESSKIEGAFRHLGSSLALLARRPDPDYRNSIKESISAVECIARLFGADNSGLDKPLKELEKKTNLSPGLCAGFKTLYGFTSGPDGIRHAMLESQAIVGIDEAKFMLVACSAFVVYLISKAKTAGVLKQ